MIPVSPIIDFIRRSNESRAQLAAMNLDRMQYVNTQLMIRLRVLSFLITMQLKILFLVSITMQARQIWQKLIPYPMCSQLIIGQRFFLGWLPTGLIIIRKLLHQRLYTIFPSSSLVALMSTWHIHHSYGSHWMPTQSVNIDISQRWLHESPINGPKVRIKVKKGRVRPQKAWVELFKAIYDLNLTGLEI